MKRHAPATARNSGPIAQTLAGELPSAGTVLEIASGTGEHAVFLSRRFPALNWQPSDSDPGALNSIRARRAESAAANLLDPIRLNASAEDWPAEVAAPDAILCINLVHISPWSASEGLFAGAGRTLEAGAPLILYGPFLEQTAVTAPSNLAFDRSLRARDRRWGLRGVAELNGLAAEQRLALSARYAMPAKNLLLVWRKD